MNRIFHRNANKPTHQLLPCDNATALELRPEARPLSPVGLHFFPRLFTPTQAVKIATPADLPFVIDLQKKFSNELGFLPTPALDWYVSADRVLLAMENDSPAGYLLGRRALRWNPLVHPITQAAIHFDAQRRQHGLTLIAKIEADARSAGQTAMQANCREGLEANEFWRAAGFELICRFDPGNARKRHINCWRKRLIEHPGDWFSAPPPVAGWKAKKVKHESS